ncbi:OsmC family protein [Flavobacterium sp.]|uniref:OsmC family protein n=1 Tax=Flavobacterium sp. TaxID=239 RepID=UPI0025C4A330|nr:OsmC family protein [Flavobacterium sp.]
METSREYQVDVECQVNGTVKVSAVIFNNDIEVSSYSCLKNLDKNAWSAEHLFLAAVETSYMSAFFNSAQHKGIRLKKFKSSARASILVSGEFSEITDIVLRPIVSIEKSNQINKTLKIFSLCKEYCLVVNALKVRLHIFPTVRVEQ